MEDSAMMSAVSEAWSIMIKNMDMSYDGVGKVFEKWSSEGELVRPSPLFQIPPY